MTMTPARLWRGRGLARGAVEVDGQDGDVGGGDAADAQGLAQAARSELLEFLFGFVAQAGDGGVVERGGDELCFELGEAVDGSLLAGDVAIVLDADFNEAADVGGDAVQRGDLVGKRGPVGFGAAEEIEGGGVAEARFAEERDGGGDGVAAGGEAGVTVEINEADVAAELGEALIRIVGAEVEAVLGAAGEHAI